MQKTPKYLIYNATIGKLPDDLLMISVFVQKDDAITFLQKHEYYELGWCREGSGIFVVGNKVLPYQSNDVICIPPGEAHLARSLSGHSSEWVYFFIDFHAILPDPGILARLSGEHFRNIFRSREIIGILERILAIDANKSAQRTLHLRAELLHLAAELVERAQNEEKGESGNTDSHLNPEAFARIQKAVDYFVLHYGEKIQIPKVASLCALSRTHFRRIFLAATGMTPQHYLNHFRIGMALTLLRETDASIAEIAFSCGFPTLSSFNRQFQIEAGTSPTRWRAMFHNEKRRKRGRIRQEKIRG